LLQGAPDLPKPCAPTFFALAARPHRPHNYPMTQSPSSRPVAVVTGASSGIGEEFARQLAARGFDLVLVARRTERLEKLAEALRTEHAVDCAPIQADLSKAVERERVCSALENDRSRIEMLVNNAGFGTHGFFHETDLARELEMIEVNCAAPVHLTKRLLPWMMRRNKGYILNVASLSAYMPGPVMAMYFASKAFMLSFSEALWEECRNTGVIVTALCPGPVKTEFQGTAGLSKNARSSGTAALPVDRVVREGLEGVFGGDRSVIPGYQQKFAAFMSRVVPKNAALRSVRRIQEERRRQSRNAE
jgi:short-subunit dehydrogenase